jgi:hypothetical protein
VLHKQMQIGLISKLLMPGNINIRVPCSLSRSKVTISLPFSLCGFSIVDKDLSLHVRVHYSNICRFCSPDCVCWWAAGQRDESHQSRKCVRWVPLFIFFFFFSLRVWWRTRELKIFSFLPLSGRGSTLDI